MSLIACCLCAKAIEPNDINMCLDCLRGEVDITESVGREGELMQCSECFKWQIRSDGSSKFRVSHELWNAHELESPGLLAVCLKKIPALQSKQLKVVESSWIWTEPHSRRLKVALILEAEVLNGKASIRQKAVVEFVIKTKKCTHCLRTASDHSWGSLVQIRQRSLGATALVALEELLVKSGLSVSMSSVSVVKDGLDVYCPNKNQGDKITEFISSKMPVRIKSSKKQVSKTTTEYVNIVEIAPVCKGDLLPYSPKPGGRITDLMLVTKLASIIHMVNPMTLRTMTMNSDRFFANPISALLRKSDMVSFVVLDVQILAPSLSNSSPDWTLADVEVARESDFGVNDKTCLARSHLGRVLSAGDSVLGFDLQHAVMDDDAVRNLGFDLQDVILVKKQQGMKPERSRSKKKSVKSVPDTLESVFEFQGRITDDNVNDVENDDNDDVENDDDDNDVENDEGEDEDDDIGGGGDNDDGGDNNDDDDDDDDDDNDDDDDDDAAVAAAATTNDDANDDAA